MSVVLITGCSSGFGLAAAMAFAQRADTMIATMRNPDKAGPLRAAASAAGLEVEVEQLDVTDARRGSAWWKGRWSATGASTCW